MSEDIPSRAFEKLVAAVQKHLDPQATVAHDVHVVGVRSGQNRQIDVAVRGKVGSKDVLVVVECRHYTRSIDVGKIDGFVGFIDDVQASAGIMVTTIGYSPAALERAAAEGIETWVLRPASNDDWQGYLRSVQTVLSLNGVVYYECEVEFTDGRKVPVSPETVLHHPCSDPPAAAFEFVMNYVRQQHGHTEGTRLRAEVNEPLFLGDREDPSMTIRYLSAVPRTEELLRRRMVTTAPQDWVFRRYRPGDDESNRTFLEVAKLRAVAETL